MLVYKIAIAGASSLLGKELKDVVVRVVACRGRPSPCLDEDQGLGQLDQVGDEITFVQAIDPDSFEHVDFTFFCGSESSDSQALARGTARRFDGA